MCCPIKHIVALLLLTTPLLTPLSLRDLCNSHRLFMSSLPAVEDLEKDQLPALSRLHLSSASNLMATIKLLAPRAFAEGASSPDELLLAQLDGNLLDMVSCLVELQLFHLQRAALLAAHSRRHMKHACHMHSSSCLGSSAAHSGTSHCQTTDSSASLHTL